MAPPPVTSRVPTRPMPPLIGGAIEIAHAESEDLAKLFNLIARCLRTSGKVRITVEAVRD